MDRQSKCLALEKRHVYDVYDSTAHHFRDVRYKAWPKVRAFLAALEPASLVVDVGCGSGKYLHINKDIFKLGCDRSPALVDIARSRHHEVVTCDNLHLPYRDNVFDAVISIGVIHHLTTKERRLVALKELARILRPGGKLMVYVWAMEQKTRKFDAQDVLVPWHLQPVTKPKRKKEAVRMSYSGDVSDDEAETGHENRTRRKSAITRTTPIDQYRGLRHHHLGDGATPCEERRRSFHLQKQNVVSHGSTSSYYSPSTSLDRSLDAEPSRYPTQGGRRNSLKDWVSNIFTKPFVAQKDPERREEMKAPKPATPAKLDSSEYRKMIAQIFQEDLERFERHRPLLEHSISAPESEVFAVREFPQSSQPLIKKNQSLDSHPREINVDLVQLREGPCNSDPQCVSSLENRDENGFKDLVPSSKDVSEKDPFKRASPELSRQMIERKTHSMEEEYLRDGQSWGINDSSRIDHENTDSIDTADQSRDGSKSDFRKASTNNKQSQYSYTGGNDLDDHDVHSHPKLSDLDDRDAHCHAKHNDLDESDSHCHAKLSDLDESDSHCHTKLSDLDESDSHCHTKLNGAANDTYLRAENAESQEPSQDMPVDATPRLAMKRIEVPRLEACLTSSISCSGDDEALSSPPNKPTSGNDFRLTVDPENSSPDHSSPDPEAQEEESSMSSPEDTPEHIRADESGLDGLLQEVEGLQYPSLSDSDADEWARVTVKALRTMRTEVLRRVGSSVDSLTSRQAVVGSSCDLEDVDDYDDQRCPRWVDSNTSVRQRLTPGGSETSSLSSDPYTESDFDDSDLYNECYPSPSPREGQRFEFVFNTDRRTMSASRAEALSHPRRKVFRRFVSMNETHMRTDRSLSPPSFIEEPSDKPYRATSPSVLRDARKNRNLSTTLPTSPLQDLPLCDQFPANSSVFSSPEAENPSFIVGKTKTVISGPEDCSKSVDSSNEKTAADNSQPSQTSTGKGSQEAPQDGSSNESTYHRYYHVFRQGELVTLIENDVDELHTLESYYDNANWCVVAEKVQVWKI